MRMQWCETETMNIRSVRSWRGDIGWRSGSACTANELPRVECPDYARWREGFDAAGLTLIFPEGFMNNPASIFGHTLLRVDARGEDGGQDVLGWAVDFTARSGGELLILYMAKGVFGFYPGLFGIRPYYQQLKRYADWENRDIWEYRLNVDQGGLDCS